MRISLNWLKKYVDIKVSNEELVRLIGARLVEVEEVIDETKKYDNIFVVKVVDCEHIEGTHLSLCHIDCGDTENLVQVVCGAPNVRAGMLAAWIAPGAIVPQSVHEDAPFVIGKRKMLGKYDSNGMLAGADELDLGDDHSGIVEIDPNMAKAGDRLADVFELDDLVLDIENKSLTHRPDCFGLIGFAREVAGILGEKFNEPTLETVNLEGLKDNGLTISITDAEICPRYSAIILEKHGELSHKYLTWQDTILAKSGMRPVDPIVDATNYLMLLTGQPLHAFDYDKFVAVGKSDAPKIIVRLAKPGEKMTLLDGKEIELNETDIVITSNDIPVALAGAMGGASTMIDDATRNVILESATFSLYNLRKTQMAHGIFSEAITRFTKGQPAYQTVNIASACAAMLGDGFKPAAVADAYPKPAQENVVKVTTEEINGLLGTTYSEAEIIKTLENVGFVVKSGLEVTAPAWRTDIHIKEDIIEEVGRLNGYDNITPTLPAHATADENKMFALKADLRHLLSGFGANETLTYTFIHGDLMKKVGQKAENSYRIVNSISPDLQYLRQSIVPSLLVKSYDNIKAGHNQFVLFEMNQVFQKGWQFDEDGVPVAKYRLALVVANKSQQSGYYLAKKYLLETLAKMGIAAELKPIAANDFDAYYEPRRSAAVYAGEECLGVIGEMNNETVRNLKLTAGTAAFELDLEKICALRKVQNKTAEISEFPSVYRDLTVTTEKSYAEIYGQIAKIFAERDLIVKIEPVSIYQPANQAEQNLSFHFAFSDRHKTLDAAEINDLMAQLEQVR